MSTQPNETKAFALLSFTFPSLVSLCGFQISVRQIDDASKVLLSTSVYQGDSYFPKSVKHSIKEALNPESSFHTFLTVDEERFNITLNYLGKAEDLSEEEFKAILNEFSCTALQWRQYFEDHEKKDLVYVTAR